MRRFLMLLFAILWSGTLFAQLTPEQRVLDFQHLAAFFAKRYAPAEWKKQALRFDVLNLKPWLERAQAVKDDLGFFELQAQYVAQLNDIHTAFQMNSTFAASLGITVDIYDGKVLIDSISRRSLPEDEYPFEIGDELVSLDGKTAEEWITFISGFRQRANPSNTRRVAAGQITARSQTVFPRAIEIGDSATVMIRRASGDLETYFIFWTKTGLPVTSVVSWAISSLGIMLMSPRTCRVAISTSATGLNK